MRSFAKEHEEEVVVPPVPVVGWPLRAAWTFAIVALLAPNEERSERMDWICEDVRDAACATGASESIDIAIASPVATAATFTFIFIPITIVNFFKSTWVI